MRINVHELRIGPQEIEVNEAPADLQLAAEGFTFPGRVTGTVRFQLVSKHILANGRLETAVETGCVRCLEPMTETVRAKVELVFEPRPAVVEDEKTELKTEWETEEREADYYDEEFLDPTDPFRQLLLLELPAHPVCKAECRGLCPTCGGNRNLGECRCGRPAGAAAVGESDWKLKLKELNVPRNNERR